MSFFVGFIRSASTILPEVKKPLKKLSLKERFIWTAMALVIYLTMAQTPLYGVPSSISDQFAMARVIFASAQGSLVELGIGPIVTAGLIMQLLKGSGMLRLDFKKPEDRALFTSATKILTLVVTLVEASAFILGGVFGPSITFNVALIILLQLFFATMVIQLLDELVQKGWGIGSGISLFILAGVAQKILWDLFSPLNPQGEYFGVIPFTISAALNGNVGEAFFRDGRLPSLFSLILTIGIILSIVYMEGMRIEIPITSTRFRGFSGIYPIKLLYVSNIPVILTSALMANVLFFSRLMWSRFGQGNNNPFFSWIATYGDDPTKPTGGLIYYITSPGNLFAAMQEPIRAITYILFIVVFAVLFAKLWVSVGGLSPHDAAKSLIDAKIQIPGFRRSEVSIESILARYIPSLTIIGGLVIGLLASGADLLGAFGSGTGILLMVSIIIQYYQLLLREHIEDMMPRLGSFLGRG
ncbi:MAG: preprotein translocase subunit SecY [Nitrososphaerales archaeon]